MLDIYSLLNSARRTALLVQVRFTTVFRWTRSTGRKTYMRAVPITDIFRDCVQSMVANRNPLITLWESKATIVDTKGVPVSHQLVRLVLKTLGQSRKRNVRFHPWPSSTEIAAAAFPVRCARYEAQESRFVFPILAGSRAGFHSPVNSKVETH